MKTLNKREKYSLYLIGGAISLFVVIQFFVFPQIDKRNRLKRTVQANLISLREIRELAGEYETLKKRSASENHRISQKPAGFTLFSFLDRLAGKAGVKDQITYMKPSTSTPRDSRYRISNVEMKLQGLVSEQLVTYLHMIETSENSVYIKRMSLSKAGKERKHLNVILEIETVDVL